MKSYIMFVFYGVINLLLYYFSFFFKIRSKAILPGQDATDGLAYSLAWGVREKPEGSWVPRTIIVA